MLIDPISLIIWLVVIGFLLWLANRFIPMQPEVRNILNLVVVICIILWLVGEFGLLRPIRVPLPR